MLAQPNEDVLEQLTSLLVEEIPRVIASRDLPKPVCSVRVYYYDTCASTTYLTLRTMSEGLRSKLVAEHGWNAPFQLWSSGEEERDGDVDVPNETAGTATDMQIQQLFAHVYSLLSSEHGDGEDHMLAFRKMLHRVCRELNAQDWSAHCEVTDDFLIAPADGDQHYGGDEDYNDLVSSVPPERISLLRRRGFLGPDKQQWDCLPDQRPK